MEKHNVSEEVKDKVLYIKEQRKLNYVWASILVLAALIVFFWTNIPTPEHVYLHEKQMESNAANYSEYFIGD